MYAEGVSGRRGLEKLLYKVDISDFNKVAVLSKPTTGSLKLKVDKRLKEIEDITSKDLYRVKEFADEKRALRQLKETLCCFKQTVQLNNYTFDFLRKEGYDIVATTPFTKQTAGNFILLKDAPKKIIEKGTKEYEDIFMEAYKRYNKTSFNEGGLVMNERDILKEMLKVGVDNYVV